MTVRADSRLEEILREGLAEGVATAASAWIWHDGRETATAAAGTTRQAGVPVTTATCFDVASLTKPFAATLAAVLVCTGRARPQDVVVERGAVTLEQVLAHRGGFEAWLPLFEGIEPARRGTPGARRAIIEAAIEAPRAGRSDAATIYSDLGFISLVPWLERTSGYALDEALRRHVTGPLGQSSIGFRPAGAGLHAAHAPSIPATEDVAGRGGVIQGQVHDDNAHAMGGVSTHAGLFGPASEVGALAVALLEARRTSGIVSPEVAYWLTSPVAPGARTPGWDVRSPEASSTGNAFGINTFGHLGYTGCSLWADPDLDLVACLLTNRVHLGRENERIRLFRPRFHDAVHDLACRGG